MTQTQQILTIAVVVAGTQLTRWLPFFLLRSDKQTPAYIRYIGQVLPPAIFGMLVVYCFRDLDFSAHAQGPAQIAAGGCVALLQLLFKNMGLSILAGTALYMIWVN